MGSRGKDPSGVRTCMWIDKDAAKGLGFTILLVGVYRIGFFAINQVFKDLLKQDPPY